MFSWSSGLVVLWSPGLWSRGTVAPIIRSSYVCKSRSGFFKAVRACLTEQHVGSVCKTSYICKWKGLHLPPPALWLFQSCARVPQMAALGAAPTPRFFNKRTFLPLIIIHLQAGGSCRNPFAKLRKGLPHLAACGHSACLCSSTDGSQMVGCLPPPPRLESRTCLPGRPACAHSVCQKGWIFHSLLVCRWRGCAPPTSLLPSCLSDSQGSM